MSRKHEAALGIKPAGTDKRLGFLWTKLDLRQPIAELNDLLALGDRDTIRLARNCYTHFIKDKDWLRTTLQAYRFEVNNGLSDDQMITEVLQSNAASQIYQISRSPGDKRDEELTKLNRLISATEGLSYQAPHLGGEGTLSGSIGRAQVALKRTPTRPGSYNYTYDGTLTLGGHTRELGAPNSEALFGLLYGITLVRGSLRKGAPRPSRR